MEATSTPMKTVTYDDGIVRAFTGVTVLWGIVGFLVGVIVAAQLAFWQANFGVEWLSFGRLRPLHTNAAIFAFVGNGMFAGIYYSTQRLLKVRMASDLLSWAHFWIYQLIIVLAAVTLPLGLTQGKEYAELIWPIDLLVVLVWVIFAANFFWTIAIRNEKNLYVALWFYIATIVTIAVLYIVNNLQLPTSLTHSYSIFGGVQDALVQWWYGHNAVAFFLTTPILGIMYYYLPKAANRPVYSYRLSVVHFWSLVFIYIWAGPHHLLYTALPDWAQTLGMIFSLMLWAPSWGGMLNGLLTLRGAWDKLRTDPVIKFFAVAVTFYGMATFEGPLLSIKSVSALGHYTDWIIGHAHGGALGWNAFMTFGMLYWLVPRLWNTRLWSQRLAETHFWLATVGILLYIMAMWIGGISQGLFWRALDADGFLRYPDFIEGLLASRFMYGMRLAGGLVFFSSYLLLIVNLGATIRVGSRATCTVQVVARPAPVRGGNWRLLTGSPVIYAVALIAIAVLLGISGVVTSALALALMVIVVIAAILSFGLEQKKTAGWHSLIEGNSLVFTILVVVTILIGGLVEIIPTIVISNKVPVTFSADLSKPVAPVTTVAPSSPSTAATTTAPTDSAAAPAADNPAEPVATASISPYTQQPYSPLELEGRDIYVREGCYVCHSQMIRPFRHETLRYGDYSRMEEFIYDHPFQWGSKRTGPDLHRVGGKYANLWHYLHLMDPRSTSPGSNMPSYHWLKERRVNLGRTAHKMQTLAKLGVPYTPADFADAFEKARRQGQLVSQDLAKQDVEVEAESEMTALIAYLQRLGRGSQPSGAASPAVSSATGSPAQEAR